MKLATSITQQIRRKAERITFFNVITHTPVMLLYWYIIIIISGVILGSTAYIAWRSMTLHEQVQMVKIPTAPMVIDTKTILRATQVQATRAKIYQQLLKTPPIIIDPGQ